MNMTTAQAAAELSVSVNTFKKLIAADLLPEVSSRGNRTLVPAADVRALARREAVGPRALGVQELAVLRVGPAVRVSGDPDREWAGYAAGLTVPEKREALRGWWRCDPARVMRSGLLVVTVGPFVVAVLSGLEGVEPGEGDRYRFTAQLAGHVTDLVTPAQCVEPSASQAALARRLIGRRLESASGGPIAYVLTT